MLDVLKLAVQLKYTIAQPEASASMNGGANLTALNLRAEERNLPPCQQWAAYWPAFQS